MALLRKQFTKSRVWFPVGNRREASILFLGWSLQYIRVDPAGAEGRRPSGLTAKGATYVWLPRCFDTHVKSQVHEHCAVAKTVPKYNNTKS